MKIRNIYERISVRSCPGTPEKVIYGSKVLKNGRIATFEKGTENYYEYIQSFADSVDIEKTIQKFINGDVNALNQRKGEFIDCTQFPTNYAEVLNVINNATNLFNSLPIDDRAKFNFNLNEFIASIGTEKYNQVLGVKPDKAQEIINTNPSSTSNPEVTPNPSATPNTAVTSNPAATPIINKGAIV